MVVFFNQTPGGICEYRTSLDIYKTAQGHFDFIKTVMNNQGEYLGGLGVSIVWL
jgi:hypothetical protein